MLSVQYAEATNPVFKYEKIGASEEMNDLVDYAYQLSDGDKDFIHTIECESGWHHIKQSNVYKDGVRETSYGLCQWNTRRWSDVVNDPNFSSAEWQVSQCYGQWRQRVSDNVIHRQLYGYNRKDVCATHFRYSVDFYELRQIIGGMNMRLVFGISGRGS